MGQGVKDWGTDWDREMSRRGRDSISGSCAADI